MALPPPPLGSVFLERCGLRDGFLQSGRSDIFGAGGFLIG